MHCIACLSKTILSSLYSFLRRLNLGKDIFLILPTPGLYSRSVFFILCSYTKEAQAILVPFHTQRLSPFLLDLSRKSS